MTLGLVIDSRNQTTKQSVQSSPAVGHQTPSLCTNVAVQSLCTHKNQCAMSVHSLQGFLKNVINLHRWVMHCSSISQAIMHAAAPLSSQW